MFIETFNEKMQDELFDREIFYSLKEAQVMIEVWRQEYNTVRPQFTGLSFTGLGYFHPAAFPFSTTRTNIVSGTISGGRSGAEVGIRVASMEVVH